LSAGTKVNLLTDIIEEAERLDRYVTSLLNMAKLEAGSAAPIFSLYDIDDIVSATLRRTAKILAHHHVELDLDSDLPMVKLDGPLFEQVLFNLLDNAAKYSPRESAIRIRARRDADAVCLQVLDEGPGIPDAELNSIFEKFYRVNNGNQAPAGTGLGLTICRGFIEAMHGSITAANRIGQRGAVFTVKVNSSREPPDHDPLERKPLAMVA
jgi:two-component system sensor histidine kinase KdpD